MIRSMKNDPQLKQELFNKCSDFVHQRHVKILKNISDIQFALTSETKNSAGDKHETGRAMLQLEREKAGQQLAEVEKLKEALEKIDLTKSPRIIGLGSLVFTSQANYFLAISAGQFVVDSQAFFAISPQTPIGQMLNKRTIGDMIKFREQAFTIRNIY